MQIKTLDRPTSHLREALVDGEVASWLTVIDYQMRVGSSVVKMGAISDTYTKARFRMKGCMRTLIEDTLAYLANGGYAMSVVTGIPNFYYHFGYASGVPDRTFKVPTFVAEEAGNSGRPGRFRVRKARKADSERLVAVYDHYTRGTMCALARDAEFFAGFDGAGQRVVVAEDEAGGVVGYAVYAKASGDRRMREVAAEHDMRVTEVAAVEPEACPALMGALARVAMRWRVGDIVLSLAPDEPFAEFCQRYGGQWNMIYRKNSHTMVRIIDQQALFRAMLPDLARRIRYSEFADGSARLTLKTDIGRTTFSIDKGALELNTAGKEGSVVELSQAQLAQVVVGYRSARDALAEAGARASDRVQRLLAVLFPPGYPRLWRGRRFEERGVGYRPDREPPER